MSDARERLADELFAERLESTRWQDRAERAEADLARAVELLREWVAGWMDEDGPFPISETEQFLGFVGE